MKSRSSLGSARGVGVTASPRLLSRPGRDGSALSVSIAVQKDRGPSLGGLQVSCWPPWSVVLTPASRGFACLDFQKEKLRLRRAVAIGGRSQGRVRAESTGNPAAWLLH